MSIAFPFVPLPAAIWTENIELTASEFRLLGYLSQVLKLGIQQQEFTDDMLLRGGGGITSIGMARNSLKNARAGLCAKGFLICEKVGPDPARARWTYRLDLSKFEYQVSKSDTTPKNQVSKFDNKVSKDDSLVSKVDTLYIGEEKEKEFPLNPPKGEPEKAPASKSKTEEELAIDGVVEKIFRFYCETMKVDMRYYSLTPKRRTMITTRLVECHQKIKDWKKAQEMMEIAIEACANDEWAMGKSKNSVKTFNDIDNIFRNSEQTEKWLKASYA